MTALLMALVLAAPVQEAGELEEETTGFFLLDWLKDLDEADLSWWPSDDVGFELSGNQEWEIHVFGGEAPGLTVEDPSFRLFEHHRHHHRGENEAESPEYVHRTDLWLTAYFGDFVSGAVMGRLDRGPVSSDGTAWDARLEQGFLRAGLPEFTVQAGKFSAPVGNFIPRHAPRTNPLVTWPLPYDAITVNNHPTDTAATILGRRDARHTKDWRPVLWREMYAYGAMAFGSGDDWEYAAALMTSAPGSWPLEWSRAAWDFQDPVYYGRAAFKPDISTKIGVSYSRGPYEKGITGFDEAKAPQQIVGFDVEWSEGDLDLHAEVFLNSFRVPAAGNLVSWSWYVEAKYQFTPGLFGAARVGQMIFDEITGPDGASRPWDRDVTRYEIGAGYAFTRNTFMKTSIQFNETSGGREPDDWMWSTQFGFTF